MVFVDGMEGMKCQVRMRTVIFQQLVIAGGLRFGFLPLWPAALLWDEERYAAL